MKSLQLVKSESFGEIQCDIYQGDRQFYMTREQIGRALEYENPRNAIKDIHARHKERLNRADFSGGRKMTTPSGGTQTATVYTRKGIMEICRHSQQPKADAFMDWVWDVMDDLITGKATIVPKGRLGEVNSAARLISQTLKEAGVAPQFRAVALKNIYEPAGIAIPLDGITMPTKLYEPTEIAKMFGMCSKSGKPHGQAMAALIRKLPLEDGEREVVPFSNQQSGHSGTAYQYAETILPKVRSWLENNGYPTEIHEGDRTFKVAYEESLSA